MNDTNSIVLSILIFLIFFSFILLIGFSIIENKHQDSRWFASKDFKLEEVEDCNNRVIEGDYIYCVE